MKKTFCVYETYKLDDPNKNYIGKSSLERIKERNYLGNGKHLNNAIKKYGKKMFAQRILKEFNTESAAYEYEKSLEPHKNGYYNITIGGRGGQDGRKPTAAQREQSRQAHLGKKKPGTSAGLKVNNPMFKEENKAKLRGNQNGLRKDITMKEIQPLLDRGYNRNEIGRILGCSPHTIKSRILGVPIKKMWEYQKNE